MNVPATRCFNLLPATLSALLVAAVWALGSFACHLGGWLQSHGYEHPRPREISIGIFYSRYMPPVIEVKPPPPTGMNRTIISIGYLRLRLPSGWRTVAAKTTPQPGPTVWFANPDGLALSIDLPRKPPGSVGRAFFKGLVNLYAKQYGSSASAIVTEYHTAAGLYAAMAAATPADLQWTWGPERWQIDTLLFMRSTTLLADHIYRLHTNRLTAYIFVDGPHLRRPHRLPSASTPPGWRRAAPARNGAARWHVWACLFGPEGELAMPNLRFRLPKGAHHRALGAVIKLLAAASLGKRWHTSGQAMSRKK